MKVIQITEFGDSSVLKYTDLDIRKPSNNEIIIKVLDNITPDELNNLIKINKMMLNKKIPNLYNHIYFILKCNNCLMIYYINFLTYYI